MSQRVGRPLILDTMLLVLLVVGMTSREHIGRHKRLRAYLESDFDLLTGFIVSAAAIIVTPNTLAEASSLLRQIAEPARTQIYEQFRRVVGTADEVYLESRQVADRKEFLWLGLTDAALLQTAASDYELLTADSRLYAVAARQGVRVTNFNHHRQL